MTRWKLEWYSAAVGRKLSRIVEGTSEDVDRALAEIRTTNPIEVTPIAMRQDCHACGGAGWGDGFADTRRDGQHGRTECYYCHGKGYTYA